MPRVTPLRCRASAPPLAGQLFGAREKKCTPLRRNACSFLPPKTFALPGALLALSRRSPGASPALSPALPQRSPGTLPTPLKCRTCAQLYSRPSHSFNNLRCRAPKIKKNKRKIEVLPPKTKQKTMKNQVFGVKTWNALINVKAGLAQIVRTEFQKLGLPP